MFCPHNEPHLVRLFIIFIIVIIIYIFFFTPILISFSLKFPQLGFSGHSFFPGFYLIVFEKGLAAQP